MILLLVGNCVHDRVLPTAKLSGCARPYAFLEWCGFFTDRFNASCFHAGGGTTCTEVWVLSAVHLLVVLQLVVIWLVDFGNAYNKYSEDCGISELLWNEARPRSADGKFPSSCCFKLVLTQLRSQ
jgi:hypothetical protein